MSENKRRLCALLDELPLDAELRDACAEGIGFLDDEDASDLVDLADKGLDAVIGVFPKLEALKAALQKKEPVDEDDDSSEPPEHYVT